MSDPSVTGVVHLIEETKTYGSKGFRKRLVVLEQDKGSFTNFVPVEFTRDSCDAVDELNEGDEVVSFCNTGHWAATDWFALSEVAGIENVKLYPGSMVEYSQTGGEIMNQPGLIENLLNQIPGAN